MNANIQHKISVELSTYNKLKAFARLKALKMLTLIDTMTDLASQDEELSKKIIQLSQKKDDLQLE
jgi:hypothetical protein